MAAPLDPALLNPMSPEFRANPYPAYHFLRDNLPVLNMPIGGWNLWLCFRYDDVQMLLKDNRFGHEFGKQVGLEYDWSVMPEAERPLWEMQAKWLLLRDIPDHTRLKGLMHKAFTPRIVENLRGQVQILADELLDSAIKKGEFDLIADFAYPLPVMVIMKLIGVPLSDSETFKRWSRILIGTLDLDTTPEFKAEAGSVVVEFSAYLREIVAERRKSPSDDLLSALIAAEEQGDHLTEFEMIANLIGLLVAGHETTMNLIGNGMLAFLRNPDQWALFKDGVSRGDAALTRSAVEELLRYDSPIQLTTRTAHEPMTLSGVTIPAGGIAVVVAGAPNRDPAIFPDPDRLDITRTDSKHFGFGSGIHYCLGAPLARLESGIAFETLARRVPNLSLIDTPLTYRETWTVRGLDALPVRL